MGDIHGHLLAFDQCIERASFRPEKDTLIQLGDVSDRYPDTAQVVERLLNIPRLIAIRGNHDQWTMDWLIRGAQHPEWYANGGQETIESYQESIHYIDIERHKYFFFEKQQDFFIDTKNRIFTHGGFIHPQGPAYDHPPTICRSDRTLWNKAMADQASVPTSKIVSNFKEIFIGHTPTINWLTTTPMHALNVWNLDTGAGTTGKLTIMNVDTKEYWQSDDAPSMYQ